MDEALREVRAKPLNNERLPVMIQGYFEDMNLVIRNMAAYLQPGGRVALVVANAQFAGENLPTDLMLCELAERHRLTTESIWITRYKGNSSQQMAIYGRRPVRETIVLWRKSAGGKPPRTQERSSSLNCLNSSFGKRCDRIPSGPPDRLRSNREYYRPHLFLGGRSEGFRYSTETTCKGLMLTSSSSLSITMIVREDMAIKSGRGTANRLPSDSARVNGVNPFSIRLLI